MNQSPVHKRGDTIKCYNGHDMCDVAEDVCLGDMDWASKFVNWRCDPPVVGGPWPTCRICGAEAKLNEPSAHDMPPKNPIDRQSTPAESGRINHMGATNECLSCGGDVRGCMC